MKVVLSLAVLFSCFVATAQSYGTPLKQSGKNRELKMSPQAHIVYVKTKILPSENAAPGVYKLRQDQMPCLVPDTKDIAPIPNMAGKVSIPFRGNIPNGIQPFFHYNYNATRK